MTSAHDHAGSRYGAALYTTALGHFLEESDIHKPTPHTYRNTVILVPVD
jgi:hypothetical protein